MVALGGSGEDSGPGKENEDWRAKPISRSLLRATSDDVESIQLTTHTTNGIQVNQSKSNLQNYQNTNFMLNNMGAITKDKQMSSLYSIKDIEASKINYDQTDASTACNRNSHSNHSSPLQPRRGRKLQNLTQIFLLA